MSGATDDGLVLELETAVPATIVVGKGNALFLRGRCYHRTAALRKLEIVVDGLRHDVAMHSLAVPEVLDGTIAIDEQCHVLTSRFWTHVMIRPSDADREVDVALAATLDDGRTITRTLGRTNLIARPEVSTPAPAAHLAVVVTASDPNLGALRSALAALPADAVLVVVDDRSQKGSELDALAADDARVHVVRNGVRLGPLASLERGLQAIDRATSLVAIGDVESSPHDVIAAAQRLDDSRLVAASHGASGVAFRTSILDDVLPFPPDTGAFEPAAWITAVARGSDPLVPSIGAARARRSGSLRSALAAAARSSSGFASIALAQAAVLATILQARSGRRDAALRRAERADRSIASALRLGSAGMQAASALVLLRALTFLFKLRGTQLLDGRSIAASGTPSIEARLAKIEHDIAPLNVRVSSGAPKRVNVVVPMIDFRYVFGAYLTIFHIIEALHARGVRVRILIAQEPPQDTARWKSEIRQYPGLESLLDHVEIVDATDRSVAIEVSASDAFVATTSWTAHVAHGTSRTIGRDRFLFLVMEYDPLVHATGSIHELSASAYDLPHDAVFSTKLLARFFRERELGVFKNGGGSVAIDNPIDVHTNGIVRRTDPGLLFYARPEEHAARNLFEMGVLALRRVAAARAEDLRGWRIEGIGAQQPSSVDLGHGLRLEILQRVPLDRYLATLEAYDVGLAPQATPHPGLVALDMAAAGLVTVTNSFATKSGSDLTSISPNIVACEPTIDGFARAIETAIDRSADVDARSRGRELSWPRSWDDALGTKLDEICSLPSLQLG